MPPPASWVGSMWTSVEAGRGELVPVRGGGEGPDARADLGGRGGELLGVGAAGGDQVADAEPAARAQHPGDLAQDGGLVHAEVEHAVGDHDVDRGAGQRDVLDRAQADLDVAGLGGRAAGQLDHLRGRVQADDPTRRADPAGREQQVEPGAAAEVEHGLPGPQLGHADRVAAAEAEREVPAELLRGVLLGAERVRAAGVRLAAGRRDRLGGVPVRDRGRVRIGRHRDRWIGRHSGPEVSRHGGRRISRPGGPVLGHWRPPPEWLDRGPSRRRRRTGSS